MRTWEEFLELGEKSPKGARPREPGFFPYSSYLGITKKRNRYEIFHHPEEIWKNLSFIGVCDVLCDLFTEYYGVLNRVDFNFSDNFPEEEQKFVERLCDIVRDRARFKREVEEEYERAERLTPLARRAINAGLTDKFK